MDRERPRDPQSGQTGRSTLESVSSSVSCGGYAVDEWGQTRRRIRTKSTAQRHIRNASSNKSMMLSLATSHHRLGGGGGYTVAPVPLPSLTAGGVLKKFKVCEILDQSDNTEVTGPLDITMVEGFRAS